MSDDRDTFRNRDRDDHRHDDPGSRWRQGEDRYRREAYGAQDHDRESRDQGYGRAYRDDDGSRYGGRGDAGRDRGYGRRGFGERGGNDRGGYGEHDRQYGNQWSDREQGRAGQSYGSQSYGSQSYGGQSYGGQGYSDRSAPGTYGGNGDSSYFTGNNQGGWAVGDPRVQGGSYGRGSSYGGGQYGGAADYRSHGYSNRSDDDGHRGFWDRATDEVASWFGDEDAARRREEDHRGRGPKGYTRSDDRIREDANDKLTEDPRVDASNITVTVKDGEITLDGTVSSREAKRRAEDVVDSISGAKHVQNNLRVQQANAGTGSGASGFTNNWATNSSSSAEGGVASQSRSEAASQATAAGQGSGTSQTNKL